MQRKMVLLKGHGGPGRRLWVTGARGDSGVGRRVQSRHTQRDARMGRASGRRACLSGGWVCGAGCGPCAAVRLCVWAWRGGVARLKTRVPHACRCGRGSRPVPAASAGQPTECMCAPHSLAHFAGCAAREAGLGAGGCGEEGSPHALRGQSLPPPHPRVCACDRRAGGGRAPWSQRNASSQRNRKFADGGLPADEK